MPRLTVRRTAWAATSAAALLVAGTGLAAAAPASTTPTWAPAESAPIHPGVMTYTNGAQCTSNFVFSNGTDVFLGQAAHCSGTGGSTATNGCESESLPLGTKVEVEGASRPGTLVYNSWLAMQASGETDPNACAYNDFALIELAEADEEKVNPSVPFWGGPVGLNTTGTEQGDTVVTYGNSSLRGGITQLSPKQGTSIGDQGKGWSHQVYTVTPGIPGDSGSAFMDAQGRALGVLSTLTLLPTVGSNGVGDLSHELTYMRDHSSFEQVDLVPGTEPFRGPLP